MSGPSGTPTVLSTQVAAAVTKNEGATKGKRTALKQVTYKSEEVVSDTDMKDDLTGDIMVFLAKPSEVATSETSSRQRKPKTATTTGAIKRRKFEPTVQMIGGPERRQMISPLPTSPVMQTITPTPIPRPVELESANDASAVSYISSHNKGASDYNQWTKWQTVATTDQLKQLGVKGTEMMNHLATTIQTVTDEYKAKLERQEGRYNQLYHQLKEAATQAEATASTSQQYSGHLYTLWNQCEQLKVEITTLIEQAHREILVLKLAQEGNQGGIKRLTDDIYNDVASYWTGYKAELREMIRTECGGLSNAIVALRSDFGSDIASLNKDLEDEKKYSRDLYDVVQYWKVQVDGLGLQVKSLEAKALAQAVLIKDHHENPKAVAPTRAQVDRALAA